jgi:hypothetical protein
MKWELLVLLGLLAVLIVSGCVGEELDVTDDVQRKPEIGIGHPCPNSRILLKEAAYNINDNSLELTVNNYGLDNYSIRVILTDGKTIVERPEEFFVEAGKTEVFTVENVSEDLLEVTVKSRQCQRTQDFRSRDEIKGLNE